MSQSNGNKIILSAATLSNVNAAVQLPKYDRSKLKVGIFHFGVGGFHRAHQALVMDSLFSMGLATEWGICGVGVLQFDAKMRDVMREQNCLYTLVEKESNGSQNVKVVGSIIDYLFAPDNVETVIERLVKEAKIVSLTITEGGYNINPATGEFDLEKVRDDIENPEKPKTVFGIVVEALRRKKERNLGGFTIMSCDNLQENGKIANRAFSSFAKAVDPSLAEWMKNNVTFPCSMVDRITPMTTEEDRVRTSEKLGIVDSWPVVCEPFIQWVLEDSFVAGRPPFEKTIVQLVTDVEPYEFMKLRLLNAGHQAIAYFGLLLGYVYVHDVMKDSRIVELLRAYMNKEATSTLKLLAGMNVEEYKEKIVERFQNSNVKDTLARLAVDGSDRILKFVIPVIQDRIAKGQSIWLSTALVASFAFYLNEVDENGKKIEIVDRMQAKLKILSRKFTKNSTAISCEQEIFGDVVEQKMFVETFSKIYQKIKQEGSVKTLDWLLAMK